MSSMQKSPRPNPSNLPKKNTDTQQNDKDLALRQQCERLSGLVKSTRSNRVRQSQIITSEYDMIIKTDEEEFEVVLYTSEWGFLQNMSQKAETVRPHQASLFIDNAISDAMGYRGKYHG